MQLEISWSSLALLSQVQFTSSLPQLIKDTMWQPKLYQHRRDTNLTWCRSVRQGYHCSSCWLMLTQLKWWISWSFFKQLLCSCKDTLTDRLRTLPCWILLTAQLARPHLRWSDFSETVWTLSSYIVHLKNIKRWGKEWTDLIKCNHMRRITDVFRPNVATRYSLYDQILKITLK